MGTVPISTLALRTLDRLEEVNPPVFWNLTTEIYSGLVEAMNDLLILVGRPSFSVNQPLVLAANTVWQSIPKGQLLITDIQGPSSALWRVSLTDMDYTQASWLNDWENDTAAVPVRWGPVGFTKFFVHPAPTTAIQVTVTSIPYPTTDTWPYNGSELVPFHKEFFEALEMYAAHYAQIKETGAEFQASMELYHSYLMLAERMTTIESRKDPLIFSRSFGGPVGVNPLKKR